MTILNVARRISYRLADGCLNSGLGGGDENIYRIVRDNIFGERSRCTRTEGST